MEKLQGVVGKYRDEVRMAEKQVKDCRVKAEDGRCVTIVNGCMMDFKFSPVFIISPEMIHL